ncbi:Integrase core domain-containing protein [Desulfacinum infernum DSM 9756]|uniref:Integrase core domain-containing protein n=1 Tax=Desulfacinum infernum DSM 9756 TaxID=1121391 RepID=A0A1M5J337_9BACT|nr:Integrase core domain-containing protein [Desulfacinum infernum DSM 9756]
MLRCLSLGRGGDETEMWRSLKHEDVYLRDYETVEDLIQGLRRYFEFYNNERHHQGLKGRTPAEVCQGKSMGCAA